MNVNPFSYLMNKISQKVSKSGDTMTGNLIISRNATTSELELGNNTTSKGLIILFSNNDKYEVLRSPDGMTANRNIYLPDASGTVALTSDIPTTTHGTQKTTTSSNATISYYEDICGNVVHVRISVDPSASVGAGNIESVTLSDLAHPPLDKETATSSMTVSSSDRKPLNIGILNSTKTFEIWGAMTSGRNGVFSFTYII
jgi:hypothetical protein